MSWDRRWPGGTKIDWICELKPYQQSAINTFLAQDDDLERAAKTWLSSTGSPNIVPFGGHRDSEPFWDRFKVEFNKFICDDNAYLVEKQRLSDESGLTRALMIAVISAALGASIGFAATLLAPAVTLMLCIVAQVGKNAYCSVKS